MSTKRIATINTTALYLIVFAVIIIAFLLLGGGQWMRGMMHGGRSMGMANLNWAQIMIGTVIGFLIGLIVGRRKF